MKLPRPTVAGWLVIAALVGCAALATGKLAGAPYPWWVVLAPIPAVPLLFLAALALLVAWGSFSDDRPGRGL